jgi:hypothetical protein
MWHYNGNQRKILLDQNSGATQPHQYSLRNIQLEYLRPFPISLIQPTKRRIIQYFKASQHIKFVKYILEAIQENSWHNLQQLKRSVQELSLTGSRQSWLQIEECRLLEYKTPVCTSQETHYFSATESSQLMLCKIWGFHGGDYEEHRLLGCYTMWLFQSFGGT